MHQQYQHKQLKIILLLFAITLIIVCYHVRLVSAEFDKAKVNTWSENKDTVKQFEKLSDNEKNSAWNKATREEKINFLKKYTENKGIKIDLFGFESKDLIWYKNQLYIKNGEKWLSVNFDSVTDTLKKVTYSEKDKTMIYDFEKDGKKNTIKIDEGYIDKEGNHIIFAKGTRVLGMGTSDSEKKLANLMYGEGTVEYKNGQYTIPKDFPQKVLKIGNNYYNQFGKEYDVIIKPDSVKGAIYSNNAKIYFMEKEDSATASAVVSTTQGKNQDGIPKLVALFDGKEAPNDFKDPFVQVDLTKKAAVLNDNKQNTGSNTYMQLEVFSNFKQIKGSGEQAWLKNGDVLLDFKDSNVLVSDNIRRAPFEVDAISNLANKDPNKEIYTFKRYMDNPYADFFDAKAVINEETLQSETTGALRGRKQKGDLSTRYSSIEYDAEYTKGYFKGTEEERLAAIAKDPNTELSMVSPPNLNTPGQYAASQILGQMDIQRLIAEAKANEKGQTLEQLQEIVKKGESAFGREGAVVLIQSQIKMDSPSKSDLIARAEAEMMFNAYIINKNYDSNTPMSDLTQEQIDKLPSVNRLLYELAENYRGEINIPEPELNRRGKVRIRSLGEVKQGVTSSGGFSQIDLRSDGVYIGDEKVSGVNSETASAVKSTLAYGLLNFEKNAAQTMQAIEKYPQIQQNYPFPIEIKTQRKEHNIYYLPGIIGLRKAIPGALANAEAMRYGKESQYQYYQSKGRLP